MLVAENRADVCGTVANVEQASATLARELPKLAQQLERVLDRGRRRWWPRTGQPPWRPHRKRQGA